MSGAQYGDSGLTIRDFLGMVWRRKWVVLFVIVLSVIPVTLAQRLTREAGGGRAVPGPRAVAREGAVATEAAVP